MKQTSKLKLMLTASIAFTMMLLIIRVCYSGTITYVFLLWNLFLAVVPLFFSNRLLRQHKLNYLAWCMIFGWLIFFPNAPYILTDLFHYTERYPIPRWFDLLVLTSAAWNGILLGMVSLMQVEQFMARHWRRSKVNLFVAVCILLGSYGIYLGRFLRFNSWDIITDPISLFVQLTERIILPHQHPRTWAFTLLFACMLWLVYYSFKLLGAALIPPKYARPVT